MTLQEEEGEGGDEAKEEEEEEEEEKEDLCNSKQRQNVHIRQKIQLFSVLTDRNVTVSYHSKTDNDDAFTNRTMYCDQVI